MNDLFNKENQVEGIKRGRMSSNDIILNCKKPNSLYIPVSIIEKYKLTGSYCICYLNTSDKDFVYLGLDFSDTHTSSNRRKVSKNPLTKAITIAAASLTVALETTLHIKPKTRITFSVVESHATENKLVCKVSKALLINS